MGFFTSFFSGKPADPEAEKQKKQQKDFEVLKYDGLRAQRMGRLDYAMKCFEEALKLKDDFETRNYLVNALVQADRIGEARRQLEHTCTMEPGHVSSFLTLANVCYLLEDYPATAQAARQAIDLEAGNAEAHYLLGKADLGQGDNLMCVAHLTQAIALANGHVEARLLRAKVLTQMAQYAEALEDIESVLEQDPESENALLLRGQVKQATAIPGEAEADFRRVTELNPFNRNAFLCLGRLFIAEDKPAEAIVLFDEAIELNPDFAQAYHERGRAKLMTGDKDGATDDMKRALELTPQEAKRIDGRFDSRDVPGGQTPKVAGV